jgi:hypothetical protein
MPRRTMGTTKVVFSTRLDLELVEHLRRWADTERRTVSDQIAILIEQEAGRRRRRLSAARGPDDQDEALP